MAILIVLLGVMVWRQGRVVDQLVEQEIERNNLTSSDTLEEPVSGSLKPQIINISGEKRTLNLPEQYQIDVFTDQIEKPQGVAVDDQGNVFVSDSDAQQVSVVPRSDRSRLEVVDTSLPNLSGLAWHEGDLYVVSGEKVYAYREVTAEGEYQDREIIIDDLPRHNGSVGKQILVKDSRLVISIPARCDACEERDPRYGSIMSYALDGSDEELYAKGFHSVGGMTVRDGRVVVLDQGRSGISATLPPSELNRVEEGRDYGWPFCYGKEATDPKYPNKVDFCTSQAEAPLVELAAHVAPAGITEIPSTISESLSGLFAVSYAGSDRYTVPRGYKVVVVNPDTGEVQNLITGWLDRSGSAWGKPGAIVDVSEQALLIADQEAGVIYELTRTE